MKKRIIYGLLIALLIVVICICGDKVIQKPEAIIAQATPQQKNDQKIEIEEETISQEKVEEPLYYGLTYDALVEQINSSLNSTISGYGEIFVKKSLELGVDPYLAVAIMLHETGCMWDCSNLVKKCNNVGGMKSGAYCSGSSYGKFNTLEEGIVAFIENLYNNYISIGLNTPELMQRKYTGNSNSTWSNKVNNYIDIIKTK